MQRPSVMILKTYEIKAHYRKKDKIKEGIATT
jgi:hypothetical protein